MPKKIRKSIEIYFAKLKKLPSSPSLFSSCKYPKTPSFSLDRHVIPENQDTNAATLADVDRFLCENFHSLYLDDQHNSPNPISMDHAVKPSDRFFVSPGQASSSLVLTSASSRSSHAEAAAAYINSVAVTTLSSDPYDDFKKSMKKMVEAKHFGKEGLDWDFMEELLFCYLELNDKAMHKYILKAFTDTASFQRRKKSKPRRKACRALEDIS